MNYRDEMEHQDEMDYRDGMVHLDQRGKWDHQGQRESKESQGPKGDGNSVFGTTSILRLIMEKFWYVFREGKYLVLTLKVEKGGGGYIAVIIIKIEQEDNKRDIYCITASNKMF